eukprot:gnl/Carplike_NY0171/1289_a1749_941.p1 GENE.gnl/Carplike_NY0171/1289_a1749_941~~gnl/Carplike_NY0171/1289_a1749_941.p1  ORF type:complete len:656 (+),score=150.12 gnl/Carplike_NY0171/1289_a1749_941:274-1968(+)
MTIHSQDIPKGTKSASSAPRSTFQSQHDSSSIPEHPQTTNYSMDKPSFDLYLQSHTHFLPRDSSVSSPTLPYRPFPGQSSHFVEGQGQQFITKSFCDYGTSSDYHDPTSSCFTSRRDMHPSYFYHFEEKGHIAPNNGIYFPTTEPKMPTRYHSFPPPSYDRFAGAYAQPVGYLHDSHSRSAINPHSIPYSSSTFPHDPSRVSGPPRSPSDSSMEFPACFGPSLVPTPMKDGKNPNHTHLDSHIDTPALPSLVPCSRGTASDSIYRRTESFEQEKLPFVSSDVMASSKVTPPRRASDSPPHVSSPFSVHVRSGPPHVNSTSSSTISDHRSPSHSFSEHSSDPISERSYSRQMADATITREREGDNAQHDSSRSISSSSGSSAFPEYLSFQSQPLQTTTSGMPSLAVGPQMAYAPTMTSCPSYPTSSRASSETPISLSSFSSSASLLERSQPLNLSDSLFALRSTQLVSQDLSMRGTTESLQDHQPNSFPHFEGVPSHSLAHKPIDNSYGPLPSLDPLLRTDHITQWAGEDTTEKSAKHSIVSSRKSVDRFTSIDDIPQLSTHCSG